MNQIDQMTINYLKTLNFKKSFKHDLEIRLGNISNIFFQPKVTENQLLNLAIEYSIEMSIEFKEKAEHISAAIIEYLCDEVCESLELITKDFRGKREEVKRQVKMKF